MKCLKYAGVPVLWPRVCCSLSILLYMCCHFRVLIDSPTKSAKIMADIIHHIISVILCSKTYHTFVKNRSGHMPISGVSYMIIVDHCKGLTASPSMDIFKVLRWTYVAFSLTNSCRIKFRNWYKCTHNGTETRSSLRAFTIYITPRD